MSSRMVAIQCKWELTSVRDSDWCADSTLGKNKGLLHSKPLSH